MSWQPRVLEGGREDAPSEPVEVSLVLCPCSHWWIAVAPLGVDLYLCGTCGQRRGKGLDAFLEDLAL